MTNPHTITRVIIQRFQVINAEMLPPYFYKEFSNNNFRGFLMTGGFEYSAGLFREKL